MRHTADKRAANQRMCSGSKGGHTHKPIRHTSIVSGGAMATDILLSRHRCPLPQPPQGGREGGGEGGVRIGRKAVLPDRSTTASKVRQTLQRALARQRVRQSQCTRGWRSATNAPTNSVEGEQEPFASALCISGESSATTNHRSRMRKSRRKLSALNHTLALPIG